MNRLVYEREPDVEFDEIALDYDDDDGEEDENPYEEYSTYELGIAVTEIKYIRVFAPNAKTAKEYITDFVGLDDIKMDDIDKYAKETGAVEEAPGEEPDYTVPLGIDLEDKG